MRPPRWMRLSEPHLTKEGQARLYMALNWCDWQFYRDTLEDLGGPWYLPLVLRWLWLKAQFGLWPEKGSTHD